MLNFHIDTDDEGHPILKTDIAGKALLSIPQLNKGTAFTREERHAFDLVGKLPLQTETLDEQVARAYEQFKSYNKLLNRNIFLNQILNTNQVLFYKLVSAHLEEMLPTIYTPIVGNAVESFNQKFMQPRGLYISYERLDYIDEILENRSNPDIKLIVVSDGEGVLGIGDQGVGAMMIPIAKLMVYTAIGKINPLNTLPIMLDAGTNNETLLKSPFYLGWRHKRISGKDYDAFVQMVVAAIKKHFPKVFLHWEDFGKRNADRNLQAYRKKICSFNDDIQGTGVVAVAAIIAALKRNKTPLKSQRIVIFGAGTAGMGIAYQIYKMLLREGIPEPQALKMFWVIDQTGLITEHLDAIHPNHKELTRSKADVADWTVNNVKCIDLLEVVAHVKPTILIGCSAQAGAFTEDVVKTMAKQVPHPVIFPLSNPNEKAEATPQDLITWTEGKALIATGSPFPPIQHNGKSITISQCNNFLAFPGIGLGVLAIQATRVSNNMLWAASLALSEYTQDQPHTLLPTIQEAIDASRSVAIAVATSALQDGHTPLPANVDIEALVDATQWSPEYIPYQRLR